MTALIWKLIAPFAWRIAGGIAVAALLAGGWLAFSTHYYNQGHAAAIAEIAADNKDAIDAMQKRRAAIRDCHARGLRWDDAGQVCS